MWTPSLRIVGSFARVTRHFGSIRGDVEHLLTARDLTRNVNPITVSNVLGRFVDIKNYNIVQDASGRNCIVFRVSSEMSMGDVIKNANLRRSGVMLTHVKMGARDVFGADTRGSTRLILHNFPRNSKWPVVKDLVKQCADVRAVQPIGDGSYLLLFPDAEEASYALNALNNLPFVGNMLRVEVGEMLSKEELARRSTPPAETASGSETLPSQFTQAAAPNEPAKRRPVVRDDDF